MSGQSHQKPAIVWSTTRARNPRTVVSTSGNSGIPLPYPSQLLFGNFAVRPREVVALGPVDVVICAFASDEYDRTGFGVTNAFGYRFASIKLNLKFIFISNASGDFVNNCPWIFIVGIFVRQ